MSEKVRLNNPNTYPVGIITPEKPYGVNILPGSFTMVTQDEIDYLMSTSNLFTRGVLRLPGEKQKDLADTLGIDMANNANFMSDEDIKKKLSGNANQLRKWLESDGIEPYVLEKIAVIAKNMNLSMNKIQVLKEKIPGFEFLDE